MSLHLLDLYFDSVEGVDEELSLFHDRECHGGAKKGLVTVQQYCVSPKPAFKFVRIWHRLQLPSIMSVLLETSVGDLVIDLEVDACPKTCENFLKLCRVYYYNLNAFFNGQ